MSVLIRTLVLCIAFAPLFGSGIRVQYLANEGFLIEGGGKKILIDALFGDGLSGYPAVPKGMREALESAQAPFDKVDLILATHYHGDHFNASAVARHLRANPSTRFLSTPQAVDRVMRQVVGESQVLERLEGIYPDRGETPTKTLGAVEVTLLRLHHGFGHRPPVQNLGFLIRLGDFQILHIGDTEATVNDFEPFGLTSRNIDLALLPSWFLTYPKWKEAIREQIQPQRIGVMHMALPSAPSSFFGPDGSYQSRLAEIRQAFPKAIVFLESGTEVRY